MDNPDINPIWDLYMGENTNVGVLRLMVGVIAFVVIGGTLSWLTA